MTPQHPKSNFIPIIVLFALFMYIIPWVLNPGTTLTLGAYDFAEFIAKQPFDNTSPNYFVILALRGQLVLLTGLVALSANRPYFTRHWWLRAIFCLILVVAQLPPLTFITNTGDINQQQQILLTIGSVIMSGIGLSGILWKRRYLIQLIIGITGVTTVLYGLINARNLMMDYGLPAYPGAGGIGLIIFYAGLMIFSLFAMFNKQTEPR